MQYKSIKTYGYSEVTVNGLVVYSFKTAVVDNTTNRTILNAKNILFTESTRFHRKSGKQTKTLNIEYASVNPQMAKMFSKRIGLALCAIAHNNVINRYAWINTI